MADVKNPSGEKLIPYVVPKIRGGEDTIFVGVNGVGWQIERGKQVMLPASVVEVLNAAAAAENDLIDFENENQVKEPPKA